MAPVYRELEIDWKGETYTVAPTYSLIQKIEQKVSIAGVSSRIASGDPPVSHVAYIVSALLQSAGARQATPEEVYAELMTSRDTASFVALASIVVSGFIPQKPGNSEAPVGGAKKQPKKKVSTKK